MFQRLTPIILMSLALPLGAEDCPPIDGLDGLLGEEARVLLLGEIHGTVESPAFALDVACHAVTAGLPVVVGLEQPPAGQAAVDRFLDSSGTPENRQQLLAGSFWQASYQDGRASWAMFDLIDGLRRLRARDAAVEVTLFDASGARGGQQRERDMAANLARAIDLAPEALTIILTGNQHSRITRGGARDSEYEPVGYLLRQQFSTSELTSLNAGHGGGTAWICAPSCGVATLSGSLGQQNWAVEIDEATRPAGHHGRYHVGHLTASRPANSLPESSAEAVISRPSPPLRATQGLDSPQEADPARPLTAEEERLQGVWRAYDFVTRSKLWKFSFAGRRFHADGGTDDWYEGRVVMRSDASPAQFDFVIEDCRCGFKGMTSAGISYWRDDSIVIAAEEPGKPRPSGFGRSSGQVMELVREREH